jgi:ribokinase
VRVAVVGHVEWVEFVRGDHVPAAGEIVHASGGFEEPAGGGAVAAVQLARMAGSARLFTALGDDELANRSRARLAELGVTVEAARRDGPTRRAHVFLDSHGERTITTIGERLGPRGEDELDWGALDGADGVYVTAGDPDALRAARRARVLVASPRAGRALADSAIELDALVFSDRDELESAFAAALEPRPRLLVATRGAEGGRYETADGKSGSWPPATPPGPIADTYGSGDSFAAAFTYGLAAGGSFEDALRQGAEAGAASLTRSGPYG